MKKYALEINLLYVICLIVALFFHIEKLTLWYENVYGPDNHRIIFHILDAARQVSRKTGVSYLLNSFDCKISFLFNDMYKDNSQCEDMLNEFNIDDQETSREQKGHGLSYYVVGANLSLAAEEPFLQVVQAQKKEKPFQSIMLIGDSLALGLSPFFKEVLAREYEGTLFRSFGKVSSGLCSPHLFNWEKKTQILLKKHKPNVLVIMMGANDSNNNVKLGKKRACVDTPSWSEAYKGLVESYLKAISDGKTPVYWVGMPITRDSKQANRFKAANKSVERACANVNNCYYIDTWSMLADEKNKYTDYIKDKNGRNIKIRARDGIHFSPKGGEILSRYIVNHLFKSSTRQDKEKS